MVRHADCAHTAWLGKSGGPSQGHGQVGPVPACWLQGQARKLAIWLRSNPPYVQASANTEGGANRHTSSLLLPLLLPSGLPLTLNRTSTITSTEQPSCGAKAAHTEATVYICASHMSVVLLNSTRMRPCGGTRPLLLLQSGQQSHSCRCPCWVRSSVQGSNLTLFPR